jgi:hypothetical protein
MIGAVSRRRALIVLLVALGVGVGFGLRSNVAALADPPGEATRARALERAAGAAEHALAGLYAVLDRARGHARRGAALTVSGEAPDSELLAAAAVLSGGSGEAEATRRALASLAGMALAVRPDAPAPLLAYGGPELELLAAQLRASADAATLFVERRQATRDVVNALAAGLAALDQNHPAAALESLDQADEPLDLLKRWAERPPLFRYWQQVSVDLIDAARGIADATLAGDAEAARAAAARYAKATAAAKGADNALAVTLSEEGSAVTSTPLQRLAADADAIVEARSAIAPLLAPAS